MLTRHVVMVAAATASTTPRPTTTTLPLLLLPLLLLSCLAGPSDAAGTAVLQTPPNCSGNYTPTDAYAANLYQLLAALPESTVSKNGGFFNGTVGAPGAPGTAYGLAMCSADYPRSDCLDCLTTATSNASGLVKKCSGSSTAMAIYDQCLVHYSDVGFFGTNYTDILYDVHGPDSAKTGSSTYSAALRQGFLQLNAAAAASPKRFAASKASPYTLSQCTWDLAPESCKACLDFLSNNISVFMKTYSTGEAKTYSCRVRHSEENTYAVFPFQDVIINRNTTSTLGDSDQHQHGSTKNRAVIPAASVAAAVVVLLAAVVVACRRRGRRRRAGSITMGGTSVQIHHLKEYTYEELKKATGSFSKEEELGRGAFGVVYKGTLADGKVIAVKKLQRTEKVEVEQFMNEVSILSGLKHKNLVKLEGYCIHGEEGLLCYEYLPDGTLEDRLHGGDGDGKTKLSWKERHHILVGICRGLQYLHDESPNDISIMHMDLKTDNILLQVQAHEDKIITPKISDFGISRNLHNDKQHEYVVQVVGNTSCVPREFIERGKASTKVDIYSFGLIILEVVTGKPRGSWSSTAQEKRHSEGFIKQVCMDPSTYLFQSSFNMICKHEYVVQVVGNTSCVPREFIERGKASTKVDIYSFGLIILEVVTGKPRGSWSSTAQEKRHSEGFIKQVREHWEKKETIDKLKDASMDNDCHHEIEKCIEIALECVHEEPAMRPDIATVVRRLNEVGHFNKQQFFL